MSTDIEISEEKFPGISIEKELKKSYLDYAMSVIIGRALPDVRDGLKTGSQESTVCDERAGGFS